jgi:hypothetical protein
MGIGKNIVELAQRLPTNRRQLRCTSSGKNGWLEDKPVPPAPGHQSEGACGSAFGDGTADSEMGCPPWTVADDRRAAAVWHKRLVRLPSREGDVLRVETCVKIVEDHGSCLPGGSPSSAPKRTIESAVTSFRTELGGRRWWRTCGLLA